VAVEPGGPAAEQEGGAAGVGVLAHIGVDDHDGHGGVTVVGRGEVDGPALVAVEMAGDARPEGRVVRKRLDRPILPSR
jgi:hypothetical protein